MGHRLTSEQIKELKDPVWRKKYTKSYYFDNNIEPYNTLVDDILDAYLLLYTRRKINGGKIFSVKKKYIKKYDYDVIGILKLLHEFYEADNKGLTYKNLLLAWGFAFDVKSKFYKRWCDGFLFSNAVDLPTTLPDPYETYFDVSSKNNRKERERTVTNYSFGNLEDGVEDEYLDCIKYDLAAEIEISVQAKDSPSLSLLNPFIKKNGEEKHLFKLFDAFINKETEEKRRRATRKKNEKYQKLLDSRKYFSILKWKTINTYRAIQDNS